MQDLRSELGKALDEHANAGGGGDRHTMNAFQGLEDPAQRWFGRRDVTQWVNLRQHCLAHLIRRATALSEKQDPEIAACGGRIKRELQRLVHMAHAPPNQGQWNAFYARFVGLLFQTRDRKDDAGRLARTLLKELDHLWVFLEVHGVAPTNNLAERMIRFGVLWRKRSQGTASEKGNRWVERILTVRQTCRLRNVATFPVLVDAVEALFFGRAPNLSWLNKDAV